MSFPIRRLRSSLVESRSACTQEGSRRQNRVLLLTCILLLMCAAAVLPAQKKNVHPLMAQQNLKHLTLEELGNLEVTTFNKAPTPLRQTPAAIYVITQEEILRSGANNIADALRLAPGVEVGRLSSTTWAVGIRGLQSNFSKSVLVLIDGRNVYTPLFAGVYWDVQDMPLYDIDRIEVIRGPGGTIWGPNSANGVINIITKKAGDTKGVQGSFSYGTVDHTIDDLQFEISRARNDARFFGRGFERGHEYHGDGLNIDGWHQERFGFRADRAVGSNAFLLEGDLYKGDSPHIIGTEPVDDQTSGGDLTFRYERMHDNGTGITLQAYVDRTLRTGGEIGETRTTTDLDVVDRVLAGENNLISVGMGLRWSPSLVIPQSSSATLVPAKGSDHVHTGFVQDEIHLGNALTVTAGAKLQHNNYSGFDIQPSGRILWSRSEHMALWGGVTRAVTTPSDIEERFLLQGVSPTLVVQVLGNPHFKSEDVLGFEGGYRGLASKRVLLDLSVFRNQYSRLQSFGAAAVSTVGSTTYLSIQYMNQIHGSISGFEVAPQISIAQPWRLNVAWSYINADFKADGATSDISSTGSVNTYEKSSPRHQVNVQSMIDLPWKIHFDQVYRYVSALPAQKVGDYQTMDVHVARMFGSHLKLEGVGQNLFQPHHFEWGTGDPSQPPVGIYRSAYVRLSFQAGRTK